MAQVISLVAEQVQSLLMVHYLGDCKAVRSSEMEGKPVDFDLWLPLQLQLRKVAVVYLGRGSEIERPARQVRYSMWHHAHGKHARVQHTLMA